ncbi:hypothetical protein ABL78_7359 [Leptomonas seymouri]|uniref:Uncharacterized protein n=1 Tax=Leptomonas seymouri TaxID=5684 RepID=A0A0N0P315_LEPSE|nr:hypothetical protein ABL78_7359 [Leptomonas seymouri]|eukprot:KPI83606.1 hypothetical protein ABL78_7359 [Leptomonas seymouri]
MRRPILSSQKEASRRPNSARSSSPSYTSTSSALAAASAWVHPRLLDAATQLLTLQPHDPFRVLSAHFSIEALQLTAYPETPAASDEKPLEEEMPASLRSSQCSTRPSGKSANGFSTKGKASSGRGDPRPTNDVGAPEVLEYLVEHSWARRCLQPYGLHAVARSVCLSPGSDPHLLPAGSNASTGHTAVPPQWMECFALLHRQSRLSSSEKATASRRASQINGAVLPPADYRATEEVPASLVLLYAMCVIEGHVRRVDCGVEVTESPHSTAVFRRLQLPIKLLALQLLAALMRRQEHDKSERCSSTSRSDGAEESAGVAGDADTSAALSDAATTSGSLLCHFYALPPSQLEQFHHWFLQRLREVVTCPTSILQGTQAAQSSSSQAPPAGNGCCVNAANPAAGASREQAALLQLQSHVFDLLRVLLSSDSSAVSEAPAFISVDRFISAMQCMASVLVAHQSTAMSMAVTLNARVGRSACTSAEHRSEKLMWVKTLLQSCTAHFVNAVPSKAPAAPPHPPPLPPLWRVYVEQIAASLKRFQQDAVNGDAAACLPPEAVVELAPPAFPDEIDSDDASSLPGFAQAFRYLPDAVIVTALVSEWIARLFETRILVLNSLS